MKYKSKHEFFKRIRKCNEDKLVELRYKLDGGRNRVFLDYESMEDLTHETMDLIDTLIVTKQQKRKDREFFNNLKHL